MPHPHVLNRILLKYRRFPQITCKFSYYCATRTLVFKAVKRKAYRYYSRKKMYRRRFFQYLRRKWLTCARGALAVKYISPLLSASSRANAAKGRGFINTLAQTTQRESSHSSWGDVQGVYCLQSAAELYAVEENSYTSSES